MSETNFAIPSIGMTLNPSVAREILEWTITQQPPNPPFVLKVLNLFRCMHGRGYRNFVETGTFQGDTAARMAAFGFEVCTIELSEELHRRAVERFAGQPKVRCMQGDSAEMLPGVVAGLTQPALFWLDGHYSGEGTAKAAVETPVLAEIACLATERVRRPELIDRCSLYIDDIRLCGSGDYPRLSVLLDLIAAGFPNHGCSVVNDTLRVEPALDPAPTAP